MLKHYYQPYRAQAERLVRQAIADDRLVIHLSSHSFTPELDGKVRDSDIGLLYDPARQGDLCERWKASLKTCVQDLTVRRNYPYAGKGHGLTAWFRRHLPARRLHGNRVGGQPEARFYGRSTVTAMRKVINRCAGRSRTVVGGFAGSRPYNQDSKPRRQSMPRAALAVERSPR